MSGWTVPESDVVKSPTRDIIPPDAGQSAGDDFKPLGELPVDEAMRGVARTVVPPVVNFLDYPVRAAAADIVGAVRGGLPINEKSRDAFYRERAKSLEQTKIKETPAGENISQIMGLPGQAVGSLVGGASNALLGENATTALGPFATVAGDVLPFAMAKRGASVPQANVRPEARTAIEAGYRLPPSEIPTLGDRPGLVDRTLSSEGGKIKTQQSASTYNQVNTNRLAAEDIGLHPETHLGDQAFAQAMQPAANVYNALPQLVPEITLADDISRAAAKNIGGKGALVEDFFPEHTTHPGIGQLRARLSSLSGLPTSVALKQISDWRNSASTNFRAIGDTERHALGLAQREAANLLEDSIERSIALGPDVVKAFSVRDAAERAVDAAKANVEHEIDRTYARAQVKIVEDNLKAASDDLHDKIAARTPEDIENAQAGLQKFREARTLFAKIYNLRDATNPTTGNVSAAGLAKVFNKGVPLTGRLKTIAEAHNTAPKAMQVPELFGHSEEWSALDFYGTMGAALSGHPGVAAGIVGRPSARRFILSEGHQRGIIDPKAHPLRAFGMGEVLQPHDTASDALGIGQ